MEWLSQNWIWLVLIVVVMMMLSRGRHGGVMGGCCGMAKEGPAGEDGSRSADTRTPAVKEATPGQNAERSPASHKHGGGGCH